MRGGEGRDLAATIEDSAYQACCDRQRVRVTVPPRDGSPGSTEEWELVDPREHGLDAGPDDLVYRRESDGMIACIEIEAAWYPVLTLADAQAGHSEDRETVRRIAQGLRGREAAARENGQGIFRDGREPDWIRETLEPEAPEQ